MSFFSKILNKLGIGKKEEEVAAAPQTTAPAVSAPAPAPKAPVAKPAVSPAAAKRPSYGPPQTSAPKAAAVVPMSEVDVVAKLEALAKGKDLDWKVSIVDLLKLLELESDYNSRLELAKELGCPEENMSDSARMNVWLHKEVLKKIAANGGNIPHELLD